MLVLTLNAGSSSLKFSLINSTDEQRIFSGQFDWSGSSGRYTCHSRDRVVAEEELTWTGFPSAVKRLVSDLKQQLQGSQIEVIVHRLVHGGAEFTKPIQLTPAIEAMINNVIPLAPLHLPGSLAAIEATHLVLPDVSQIAVFDTAFHATIPPEAAIYPIPQEWTNRWNLRRYGFHGLSHEYCTGRAIEMLGNMRGNLRLVIAHLGSGISITAIRDGQSIDTTMGFTPLEGVMMATRCGNIDPGLLIHLLRECGLSLDEISESLNFRSGLLGVSGVSADIRQVIEAARTGHTASQLAFDIYTHRLRQGIASMVASLNGVDGIVFTGGVGTHSSKVRQAVCEGLTFLGTEIDPHLNQNCERDALISLPTSQIPILVIETNEEIMLCRHALQIVDEESPL